MVDQFALILSHGLLALAAWRLMLRPDLDRDPLDRDPEEDGGAPTRGKFGRRA